MKILIVDDEPAFGKSIKAFLERLGHVALSTSNGTQALQLLRQERPDIMTLDIRMPGLNGLEVMEVVQTSGHPVKIVVISAIDMPDMEYQLIKAGARAVLRKPVELKVLADTIKSLAAEKGEGPPKESGPAEKS